MTPAQLIAKYRDLPVVLENGTAMRVKVYKYRSRNPQYGGTQAAERYKDELLNQLRRQPGHPSIPALALAHTFTGKGSVDEIITSLRIVARLGAYNTRVPLQAGLQQVCDDYIGLDCNGFVGNFARAMNLSRSHDPADRAPRDWADAGVRRRSIAAVAPAAAPHDVLVWTNGTHIALIDRNQGSLVNAVGREFFVAESSAGGLQVNPYRITGFNPTTLVFNVSKQPHGTAQVYICRMS